MKLFGACLLLLVTFTPLPAAAHVAFVSPTNRATLVVGEPVKIAWADTVLHEGVGYDLDYAGNLLGVGLSTRTHSFEWVPTAPCSACLLRITQVNEAEDYFAEVTVIVVAVDASAGGTTTAGSSTGGGGGFAGGGSSGTGSGGAASLPAGGGSSGPSGGLAPNGGDGAGGSPFPESSEPGGASSDAEGGKDAGRAGASPSAESAEAGEASGASAGDSAAEPSRAATNDSSGNDRACGIGRARGRGGSLLALLFAGAVLRRRAVRQRMMRR